MWSTGHSFSGAGTTAAGATTDAQIADMKMLLNSLYPPPDVSIHLTTARWRFLPNLRPLGARET